MNKAASVILIHDLAFQSAIGHHINHKKFIRFKVFGMFDGRI